MAKIMLLANTEVGVKIINFFVSSDDEIVALYLSGSYPDIDKKIIQKSRVSKDRVFNYNALKSQSHLEWLKSEKIDVLITVYWPFLLKRQVFEIAEKTVNFHPAMLPINRGWYPHVHSLIDGSVSGVSLHEIDDNADTGKIWAQKEVQIIHTDTAKTIYERLQIEIVKLFKDNWLNIKSGFLKPFIQDEKNAIYHSKDELIELDHINLSKVQTIEETLNLLRARSFGDMGFSYFEKDGVKTYVNIRLSKNVNMTKEKD